jgi:alpha-galactosidase
MITYRISYLAEGKEYTGDSLFAHINYQKEDNRLVVTISPKNCQIKITRAEIAFEEKMSLKDKFFSNGYQSWTDSQEQSCLQRTKKMGFLGRKYENVYHFSSYGDYNFIHYAKHYSFSYTYLRRKDSYRLYGSLSEREGYTVFYINKGKLMAYKDIQGLKINDEYKVFDLCFFAGNEKRVFDSYASMFPYLLPSSERIKGFTTWYRHYEKISQADVNRDLDEIKKKGLPFTYFQIDDGYESKVGDWLLPSQEKFPLGMEEAAKKIEENGLIPGIWMAPFVAVKDSQTFLNHPDWFLKDKNGQYLYAGSNWGGAYCLDIYNKEVRAYLHEVFSSYMKMGYRLFKLDFLYACSILSREDKARATIMSDGIDFIRNELKGMKIIGCGVPLFPSFFKLDYCRIGPDVSLTYDDIWYMKFCHRERISTKITLKNTYARRQLDHRFILNDPDVVLLKGTKMKRSQKDKLYEYAIESTGACSLLLMISASMTKTI